MGFVHIRNLYQEQSIFLFRECYALEKIHGSSAHVAWTDGKTSYFSGGQSQSRFEALFDDAALREGFARIGAREITVFGEVYGGSCQKQTWRYGKELRFVAFDVQIGEYWLSVPQAEDVVKGLGLEFVHYVRIPAELAAIDAERDAPSVQAQRNGVAGDQPREGVVLRPLIELTQNSGERIIVKHKRDKERETRTERPVIDPARLAVLSAADAIADEWVTEMRLTHVLDKICAGGRPAVLEMTGQVIKAMVEDVLREGAGELVDSKEARAAIGRKAASLFQARLRASLEDK